MSRIFRFVAVLVFSSLIAVASHAQSFFGAEYSGTVYNIDPATGTFVTVGFSGGDLPGLAYNSNTGVLYGIDGSSLYTIDQATAARTLVGTYNPGIGTPTTGLTFSSDFATLYTVGFNGNLYSINPLTGAGTLIGPSGVSYVEIIDLATHPTTGVVYAAGVTNRLYTINTSTGAAMLLGSITNPTGSGHTALAFDAAGILYAIAINTDRLQRIDLVTRVATDVSTVKIGFDVRGLAFVGPPLAVPTLNEFALLALAGMLAALATMMIKR